MSGSDPKRLVADGYDAIADRFATWQKGVRGDARMRYLDELLKRLPPQPEVLELGCGAGVQSTRMLASRGRLVGVDISEEQIRRARERIPEATFISADATKLDFPPATFDAVVAFFVLAHIPRAELPVLLERVAIWLRPNGWFLATMGSRGAGESIEASWLGVPMFFSSPGDSFALLGLRSLGMRFSSSASRNTATSNSSGCSRAARSLRTWRLHLPPSSLFTALAADRGSSMAGRSRSPV